MKTHKFLKILFICLMLISVVAGSYYFVNQRKDNDSEYQTSGNNDTSAQNTTPNQNPRLTYTETTYFVPVTGLKNNQVDISLDSLKKLETVYVTTKDKEQIKEINKLKDIKFSTLSETIDLVRTLNKDKNAIGISNISDISFKTKILSFDGNYIFDKKLDLSKYSLKTTKQLESNEPKQDISNYSHERLTKLGHTGSMIPARGVVHHIETKFKGDYKRLFESTKPLLDTFDFTSATFESPMLGTGKYCDSCMTFVGPDKFMEGVKYSGIDLFSLAANHIMNGGVAALDNTQKQLEQANIKHIGASTKNNDEAGMPVLVEVNGLKIAYVGFNDSPGYEEWALENRPGAASISDIEIVNGQVVKYEPNEERIKYFLQRAKDLKPDMIFVIMHWGGQEYVAKALPYQKRLAKLLVENGADVILGDHPHWVQEMQILSDKPVFYCVGNYIFDQMWSIETRQGLSIELDYIDKKLVNFRLYPHQLYLYDKGMPVLLNPDQKEYEQTLNRMWNVSEFDF